ncbi:MAG: hypothetical protein FWG11_00885 [Promicromonosporaceae bacterium]|nr:hypothetical protein [Promicromonosporaceae bacterium]
MPERIPDTATLEEVQVRAEEFGTELLVLLEDVPRRELDLAEEIARLREFAPNAITRLDGRWQSIEELEALLVDLGPGASFVRDDSVGSERSAPTRYRFGPGWDERWRRWTWDLNLQMAGEESTEQGSFNVELAQRVVDVLVERGWRASFTDRPRMQWTLLREDVGGVWRMTINFRDRPSMTFRIDSPEVFSER